MSAKQLSEWLEPLSQREQEILFLIKEGSSNREIAQSLHLSLETVKWYNQQIFGKLGVNSRTKAAAKVEAYGLLQNTESSTPRQALSPPHNLPSQPTQFIGRETELTELHSLLLDPAIRLVTIFGPGGIGKTRLALATAEEFVKQLSSPSSPSSRIFSDGIYFIQLTGVDRPELVFPELARVLNYQFEKEGTHPRTPEQQLLDYLKNKQMLLVIDNFEQLVEGAGLLVNILRSAPEIRILVTSRERLNLVEEHLFLTQGLPYPVRDDSSQSSGTTTQEASTYPAIRLFLQSAGRLRPGLHLTDEDLKAIIQICQQVEGLPLALELAASWADILSIEEIASEIKHSYDFIQYGLRNIQERHRSMRAVFDSSWQRLNLEEQDVFAQLSLFHGSFSRQAAQRITRPAASLGLLASLANKSLLIFDRKGGRFHIHELLRQYGAEKIVLRPDKAAAFQERFSDYFTSTSQRLGDVLKGPRQMQAMAEFEKDIQNIRLAWEWAVSQRRADLFCRAMDALGLFYQRKGRYQEGLALFEAAATRLSENEQYISHAIAGENEDLLTRGLAKALTWQSNFKFILGHSSSSDRLLKQCLHLLNRLTSEGMDVEKENAFANYLQGVSATMKGERELARQYCQESLRHYQASEDAWGSTIALEQLCVIDWYLGDQASARWWGQESLRLRQELGDQRGIADSYIALGDVIADEFNLEEAVSYAEKAVLLYQQLDDHDKIVNGIYEAGGKWMRIGDYSRGYSLQVESYQRARELNLRQIIPKLTCQIAYITNHLGNYDETYQWTKICLPLAREMEDQRSIAVSFYSLGLADLSRGRYLEAYQRLSKSAKMIRAMKDRRLLAMILAALGRAAFGVGIENEVKPNLLEALRYSAEVHSSQAPIETFMQIAFILSQASAVWARQRAVELYYLAMRYPYVSNSIWLRDTAGLEIEKSISELPDDIVAAAKTRGQTLEVWSTAAALQQELATQGWSD